MRQCLQAKDITQDILVNLPEIDEELYRNHFCRVCPYYAGKTNGISYCMQKHCAWEDDEERFSPELRKMIPMIEEEFKKAKIRYLEARRKYKAISSMFRQELEEEKREQDVCFQCVYNTNGPCLGFCYKQMTAKPTEEILGGECK